MEEGTGRERKTRQNIITHETLKLKHGECVSRHGGGVSKKNDWGREIVVAPAAAVVAVVMVALIGVVLAAATQEILAWLEY